MPSSSHNRVERLTTDEVDIQNHVVDFFKNLYTSKFNPNNIEAILQHIPRVIDDEVNRQLIAPITKDELKAACYSIGKRKASGLDGFLVRFFQQHWDTVEEDVM